MDFTWADISAKIKPAFPNTADEAIEIFSEHETPLGLVLSFGWDREKLLAGSEAARFTAVEQVVEVLLRPTNADPRVAKAMRGAMNIIMAEFLRDPPPQDATPSNIKAGAEGPRPAPGAPNRAAGSGSAQVRCNQTDGCLILLT